MTAVSKNGTAPPEDPLARGLGAFSFALGVPQILAPGRMNRMIGVKDDASSRRWMRVVGIREIAAGVGIFSERRPKEWVWARVAGDTMDLALLGSALRGKTEQPARTLAATGAVIGAFAADLLDGLKLSREPGGDGSQDEPLEVHGAITVRRHPDEVYAFGHDIERFPSFMAHLEEVRITGGGRSQWTVRGPLGMNVSWDVEITEDVPGERISWRSVEGSKVDGSGTVKFIPAPAGQGTEVHLELRYDVPGGGVAAMMAKLFGEHPEMQLKDDLRRFKQIMETGEVVRSDGSPEGQLNRRMLKQRPAHPLTEDELAGVGSGATS
ncbi:MAG TPA: SRPBCC family protein [Solirubrobacteraceae bacterium]